MKKYYYILSLLLFWETSVFAQKIIWPSHFGGANSNGAVIGYDLNTHKISTLASLGGTFQSTTDIVLEATNLSQDYYNSGGMVLGSDGFYYGINEYAGGRLYGGPGVFFRINPSNNEMELLHAFTSNSPFNVGYNSIYSSFGHGLAYPILGLIESSPGVFYGIAAGGGEYNYGGIWKYDLNSRTYSKVCDFDLKESGIGSIPNSPLIKGPNGNLFGVVKKRGTAQDGYLYKVDISNDNVEFVSSLSIDGWAIDGPADQIVYNPILNKIFGTKESISGANYGGGVYSYNFNTNKVTNESIILYSQTDILGSNADGMTPRANDGNHYFICRNGGKYNNGTLVKYLPNGNSMVKVHDFTENPNGLGLTVSGTKIYGTYNVLRSDRMMMWSYDVSTGEFNDFLRATDDNSLGYAMSISFLIDDKNVVGRTLWGGDGNSGSLFSYNTISEMVTVIQNNVSEEGRGMIGEMMLDGDYAYVFTPAGGDLVDTKEDRFSEHGGIVKVDLKNGIAKFDPVLSHYFITTRIRHQFYLGMVKSNDGHVIIPYRGNLSFGRFFSILDISMGQGVGKTISNIDPDYSYMSSAMEFAPDQYVIAYLDSIYVYDELKDHVDIYNPNMPVTNGVMVNNLISANDGKIYGTTISRDFKDPMHRCSLYSIDPNSWNVTIIHEFEKEVKELNLGLTELNGKLFGNTLAGGANGDGYLFSFDINTNTFTKEYDFNYTLDGGGFCGRWTAYNGTLYGLGYVGGLYGYGVLSTFDPSQSSYKVLSSLSLDNGLPYRATPLVWDNQNVRVEEEKEVVELSIFPNPSMSFVTVGLNNVNKIELYNLFGQCLRVVYNQNKIVVEDLEKGVYVIKIYCPEHIYISKILK